jgi:hypothetical protein
MSEPKFTKGPWKAINMSWEYSVIIDEDAARIAQVFIRDEVDEETQDKFEEIKDANANLISAAPDMYEALEEVCYDCDDTGTVDDECKSCCIYKALRKARGEEE